MTAIAGELSGLGGGKMVKDGHGVQFKAGLASNSPTMQLAQKLVKVYGWTMKTEFVVKDEGKENPLNSTLTRRVEYTQEEKNEAKRWIQEYMRQAGVFLYKCYEAALRIEQ